MAERQSTLSCRIQQPTRAPTAKLYGRPDKRFRAIDKLPPDDVLVAEYQAGKSSLKLSKKYGVCKPTILRVLQRLDIKPRDPVESHRIYTLNETAFDTITERSAYWVGFLMADGCINDRHGGTPSIVLGLARCDRSHLDKFRAFVGSDAPIGDYEATTKPLGNRRRKRRFSSIVTIHSKAIAARLADFGVVPRKSLTAAVRHLEHDRNFWRGVIDGDGSVGLQSRNGRPRPLIQLCGSGALLSQFTEFLIAAGFRPRTLLRQQNIFTTAVRGREACRLAAFLYHSSDVALTRKKLVSDQIIALTGRMFDTDHSKRAYKLSDADKTELVADYAAGATTKTLMLRFGLISSASVYSILWRQGVPRRRWGATSKFLGVWRDRRRWRAKNGNANLGYFNTEAEAANAVADYLGLRTCPLRRIGECQQRSLKKL